MRFIDRVMVYPVDGRNAFREDKSRLPQLFLVRSNVDIVFNPK